MINAAECPLSFFFTPEELAEIEKHERETDERLREGRGFFKLVLPDGYNERIWGEVSRRYGEAGWSTNTSVHGVSDRSNGRTEFRISHPLAPQPKT